MGEPGEEKECTQARSEGKEVKNENALNGGHVLPFPELGSCVLTTTLSGRLG